MNNCFNTGVDFLFPSKATLTQNYYMIDLEKIDIMISGNLELSFDGVYYRETKERNIENMNDAV